MEQQKSAVLAGGCFWCTEAIFQNLRGVRTVTSGYTGGVVDNPTYEQVSMGTTNHAEAIKIEYDSEVISYRDLLEVFFATHNPTTLNRQGGDAGTQYRSAIFFNTDEEKQIAEELIAQLDLEKVYEDKVVTQLEPLGQFYEAEDYHKNYYNENSQAPYCQVVINPKLEKFKQKFAKLLK